MLAGTRPWQGCALVEVAHKVTLLGVRLPLHNLPAARCPPALKDLLLECWDSDPRRRPAAAEVAKRMGLILTVRKDVERARKQAGW